MKVYNVGYYIKKQREEQKIHQEDLCRGICDKSTLSRIERGKQEASYFVLKALLQRLGLSGERCQVLMGEQDFQIEELQREIVSLNSQENFDQALQKIKELEKIIQERNLEDDPIHKQFLLRVKSLIGYEQDGQRLSYDFSTKRQMLVQALELTCSGITINNMGSFLLGEDEAKIINQIAITWSEEGNRRRAIEIYRQLIQYVKSHFAGCEIGAVMLPLTAYNYSRLLGLERRYEEAIEIAELGRQCCIEYNKCRMLGGLLLNIGYCLHELGEDEKSKELLVNAYYVYKAMEQTKSCEVVQKYARENLNLEIN